MKKYLMSAVAIITIAACTTSQPSIQGLWSGSLEPDNGLPVPIEVSIKQANVETSIGTGIVNAGELLLELDTGAIFSGKIIGKDKPINGFYIQPGNQIGGQRLAHAVDLKPTSDGIWSGSAKPLKRQFTLFVNITEGQNEAVTATVLNPERNITGPAKKYLVVHDAEQNISSLLLAGDKGEFTSIKFDEPNQIGRMNFGPMEDFELKSVQAKSRLSQGFFGEKTRTTLMAPNSEGAWKIGTVEGAGFDQNKLSNLVQEIASESGDEKRPKLIHSLLVARGGKLVIEEYFRNHNANTPHDIRSAGKTFASILVGALILEGHSLSADTPINQFIPMPNEGDHLPVTLGHLLTHQSGLDCYDGDNNSAGGENAMWQQEDIPNFWKFTSELNFVAEPGTRHAYCSGGINLVGAVLAGSSGQSVLSLLQTRLFKPLGFQNAYWNVMPNGEAYLGGGGQLRTRDLLKIGQLYLDDGKWLGQQIIAPEWVATSIKPKIEITPATTGLDVSTFSNFYFGGVDGFAWHLHSITVGSQTYKTYEASGNGGQMVVVVPELDLVVGMTGGNYMEGRIWGKWRQEIIGDGIIAALKQP